MMTFKRMIKNINKHYSLNNLKLDTYCNYCNLYKSKDIYCCKCFEFRDYKDIKDIVPVCRQNYNEIVKTGSFVRGKPCIDCNFVKKKFFKIQFGKCKCYKHDLTNCYSCFNLEYCKCAEYPFSYVYVTKE